MSEAEGRSSRATESRAWRAYDAVAELRADLDAAEATVVETLKSLVDLKTYEALQLPLAAFQAGAATALATTVIQR
ncbi:MAG: EscE/YscE/SsaE family type III secretion system needle protein co-chaperone [Phycisphaerae bacterium]|nr:EscE/YscE/SsaE family type III secretion system needle protein co-chaperone [Phycisphaerae bacterium]